MYDKGRSYHICDGCDCDVLITDWPYSVHRRGSKFERDWLVYCRRCSALADLQAMIERGVFYLFVESTERGHVLTNATGTLRFDLRMWWRGEHNWSGCKQLYIRFVAPDGAVWWGRAVVQSFRGATAEQLLGEGCFRVQRTRFRPHEIKYSTHGHASPDELLAGKQAALRMIAAMKAERSQAQ